MSVRVESEKIAFLARERDASLKRPPPCVVQEKKESWFSFAALRYFHRIWKGNQEESTFFLLLFIRRTPEENFPLPSMKLLQRQRQTREKLVLTSAQAQNVLLFLLFMDSHFTCFFFCAALSLLKMLWLIYAPTRTQWTLDFFSATCRWKMNFSTAGHEDVSFVSLDSLLILKVLLRCASQCRAALRISRHSYRRVMEIL